MCTSTRSFSPQSKVELKRAVGEYLKLSLEGDCSDCPHGPIGEWDVSRVTDMSEMFSNQLVFNGDISKWDVSRVKDMSGMFRSCATFNNDISKWDVSSVTDMNGMFAGASVFNSDIS